MLSKEEAYAYFKQLWRSWKLGLEQSPKIDSQIYMSYFRVLPKTIHSLIIERATGRCIAFRQIRVFQMGDVPRERVHQLMEETKKLYEELR